MTLQDKNTVIMGCGFIGKKLIKELLKYHHDIQHAANHIKVLVKTAQSQQQCEALGVASYQLDMDDKGASLAVDLFHKPTILYYFTPPPAQGREDTRIRAFIQLLQQQTSQTISKIILISTTGVYGNCHGQWVDENTPVNPSADRAYRRLDAEQQMQAYCEKMDIALVILRVSGIYSADKLPLKRIKAQTPIVCQQDSPYSNRIHSDDLVTICLKAGLMDVKGIFNCADGHPSTMYDYFIAVARTNNLPEPLSISLEQAKTQLSAGMLSYMAESRRINNQKLLSEFKISLQYPSLEQGLVS